jgi:hypothetical protein
MDAFLSKPIRSEQLRSVLDDLAGASADTADTPVACTPAT